jgi:hypothetical protein
MTQFFPIYRELEAQEVPRFACQLVDGYRRHVGTCSETSLSVSVSILTYAETEFGSRCPSRSESSRGANAQIDLARHVRVAEHMIAKVGRDQSSRIGILDEDVADRREGAQRTERHLHVNEHVPLSIVLRRASAQVERQRLGHGRQQRLRERRTCVRSYDLQRRGLSIGVLKLQPNGSRALINSSISCAGIGLLK